MTASAALKVAASLEAPSTLVVAASPQLRLLEVVALASTEGTCMVGDKPSTEGTRRAKWAENSEQPLQKVQKGTEEGKTQANSLQDQEMK